MLQNLSKLKQYQLQQQQKQQLTQQAQPILTLLPQLLPKNINQIQQSLRYVNLQCGSIIINYNKQQENLAQNIQKEYSQNIDSISNYSIPLFIKYLGLKLVQQKQQKIDKNKKQVKSSLANNDKKTIKKDDKLTSVDNKQQIAKDQVKMVLKLKIMIQKDIQKYNLSKLKSQSKSKQQFTGKLESIITILQALSHIHELQYTFFNENLDNLIYVKKGKLKMAIHGLTLRKIIGDQQINKIKLKNKNKIKKQILVNRSLRYNSPQLLIEGIVIKDIRQNDIWRIGIQIFTILTGQDLSSQLIALQSVSIQKIKEHKFIDDKKLISIKKYIKDRHLNELLKMLALIPSERIEAKIAVDILKHIYGELKESFQKQVIQQSKNMYIKQQQQLRYKFMPQISKGQELLTNQIKKKITDYVKINQTRIIKDYKMLYRASHTKFSCKVFYQIVFQRKNLLIAFLTKDKKKFFAFCQQSFDLNKVNGLFGGYIKDTKKLSFIYSVQENQFSKLKNGDRSLGVSYIQGPIIGDGDIVISDGGLFNYTNYPVSFQGTRLKKLLKNQKFELEQYDVYQVIF